MSTKKKVTKTKKKKKVDNAEPELSLEEKNLFLLRQVESLKHQLVIAENKASSAEAVVREQRKRLFDLYSDYEEEKKRTFIIAADMTGQYKSMRLQMQKKIESLDQEIQEYQDKLEEAKSTQKVMEQEKELELKKKDDLIDEHRQTMDKMAYDFSQMLKQTLEKMSTKVVISNEWENDGNKAPIVRTFDDLNLGLPK